VTIKTLTNNLRDRIKTLTDNVRARIDAEWKQSWKWGSVRIHALATALAVYIAHNPTALNDLVNQLPVKDRFPIIISAGAVWLCIGWMVRLWKGVGNG
jgi:hypothetical protein